MKKYLKVMHRSPIFSGITEDEVEKMLYCLSPTKETYAKNDFILRFGDEIESIGMVLSGGVHVIKEDFWGNRNIIAHVGPGELFAEAFACKRGVTMDANVIADEATEIMFLKVSRILETCTPICEFHARLMRNLLEVLVEKNLLMNRKLTHMSMRTTREKLLSYLSMVAVQKGKSSFDIPFNRQQLADYLSVDRSAMSNELCKMRDEGLITFERNSFVLKA